MSLSRDLGLSTPNQSLLRSASRRGPQPFNTRVSELFNSLALEGGKRRAPDSMEPAPPADLSADAHNALVRTHLRETVLLDMQEEQQAEI